jgi:hypothetical protein
MRKLALALLALLAACAAQQPPIHGETPGRICRTEGSDQFVGQPGTSETGAAILRVTHSAILRWAPPGTMLTMDFSPSRVTIRLGPNGKITAINCG